MDEQIKGSFHSSERCINFEKVEDCTAFYESAKKVFLNVSTWHHLFDNGTRFIVFSEKGEKKTSPTKLKDYVKIKIPGPKNRIGGGFDWVRVVEQTFEITKEYHSLCFVIQPCSPYNKDKPVAHFFTEDSKSYFFLKNHGLSITAEVHGRNQVLNYRNLPFLDKIRNIFFVSGTLFGFSKPNWQNWCINILEKDYLNKCVL